MSASPILPLKLDKGCIIRLNRMSNCYTLIQHRLSGSKNKSMTLFIWVTIGGCSYPKRKNQTLQKNQPLLNKLQSPLINLF